MLMPKKTFVYTLLKLKNIKNLKKHLISHSKCIIPDFWISTDKLFLG